MDTPSCKFLSPTGQAQVPDPWTSDHGHRDHMYIALHLNPRKRIPQHLTAHNSHPTVLASSLGRSLDTSYPGGATASIYRVKILPLCSLGQPMWSLLLRMPVPKATQNLPRCDSVKSPSLNRTSRDHTTSLRLHDPLSSTMNP